MSVQLKYTEPNTTRSISKADFGKLGVEDQGAVKWDESNDFIAEVSDEAARRLLETHPEQFKAATDSELKALGEDDDESTSDASESPDAPESGEVSPGAVGRTTGGRTSRRST